MSRDPADVLASCTECRWQFTEHKFKKVRVHDSDSRLKVAGKHALDHSKHSGHTVTQGDDDDE